MHLAVAGGLCIARHHAGGDLGGAAPWLLTALNGRVRLLGRQASSAPVRGDAPAHFLLPGRFGVGKACECAQGSSVPSEATSGPAYGARPAVKALEARRGSRTWL